MTGKYPHQYEIFLKKADADLSLVKHALALEDQQIDHDIIFFHLQQAVEKYLKTLISLNGVHFEKIHDIDKIIGICRNNNIELPDYIDVFIELNPYAVEGRYAVIADDLDDAASYANLLYKFKEFVVNVVCKGH